jgi:chromosome segregation ATPase
VFVVHGYPTIWLYRLLTLSTLFPLLSGGRASLTLDNMDEPYLGGIRFTIMPPMKRHM